MSIRSERRLTFLLILIVLVALGAIIGCIVLGTQKHPCNCVQDRPVPYEANLSQDFITQQNITDFIFRSVKVENLRQNLLTLTKDYHPAGSEANLKLMDFIASTWRSYGLDHVKEEEYEILLSYPDFESPNTIFVQQLDLLWLQLSHGLSTPLGPPEARLQQHDDKAKVWWNAYSKNGTAVGTIVYVNYCTNEDYLEIDRLKMSLEGKIVLCRYGESFRGDKTAGAEERKAIGLIMYSDPADCAPAPNATDATIFPHGVYMPPSGAQRGSMLHYSYGDPETPFYPAKNYTYRWYNEDELRSKQLIPNIPVTPIGYEDAYKIFLQMARGGTPVLDQSFVGGLNVTYYLNTTTVFQLNVNAQTVRRPIKNVIGYIWGKDEPDRYVLLSNHVDAWTYGAIDPNSATTVHLEVSRVLKLAMDVHNWRPRRTIVFCAWDAEEYALGGSTEWVQEKLKILESRAVAVINVDVAVGGNQTLSVDSSPLLYRAMVNATKLVSNPNTEELLAKRETVFDSWKFYYNQSMMVTDPSLPSINNPGSGSDHAAFQMYAGVPSVSFSYGNYLVVGNYPLYHTMYEIEWTMENLVDKNFAVSAAVTQVWGELIRNLADSLVIPFNVTDYGEMMVQYISGLNQTLFDESDISTIVDNVNEVMKNLTDCGSRFLNATIEFQTFVDKANSGAQVSLGLVEALNSRLSQLERTFIDPRGVPKHPHNRHVVFAPSEYNLYSGVVFSGVTDSLQRYKEASLDTKDTWRKLVNLQISVIQYSIESVIQLLRMPPNIL